MPFYDYHCSLCDHRYEEFRSVTAKPPKQCPRCKKRKGFYQVLGAVIGVHGGEPTTVGQLAERNEKGMSRERHEQLLNEGRTDVYTGPIPKGGKVLPTKPKAPTPWWRSGEVEGLKKMDKPLDLKKVRDINQYIATGDMK